MRAYIINLDSAKDRWLSVTKSFAETKFAVWRIPAVDGTSLQFPNREYSEVLYRWFHGRPTNPREVGCYLSHVKALQAFLATDDSYALIGEDDLTLNPDFDETIAAAMQHSIHWNILRITGLGTGWPAKISKLSGDHSLYINLTRLKGTGAYIVDRKAAEILVTKLLPMRLPIDHGIDREWFFGLRAACILPFPASQKDSGFRSSIQKGKSLRLSKLRRFLTTYPYQAFNETARWLFRASHFCGIKLSAVSGEFDAGKAVVVSIPK